MAYPYSKAGGGLTSVAWGDITGTLSAQSDLNSALAGKIEGVAWGAITGTLADQTDLQSALDAKQDAAASSLVATDNTYWSGGVGGWPMSWTGSLWQGTTYDDEPTIDRYIDATGSWTDGYRPTSVSVTLNSDVASEYTGDLTGTSGAMKVVLQDGFGNVIGEAPAVFSNWEEDIVVTINSLTYYDSGLAYDIDRLRVISTLKNTAPFIKHVEFTG